MIESTRSQNPQSKFKSDLKRMRIFLVIFTLLYFVSIPIYLIGIIESGFLLAIISVLTLLFNIVFIFFIWRMPMQKEDKIFETIMICLFGLLAMWAWIQFNNLKEE